MNTNEHKWMLGGMFYDQSTSFNVNSWFGAGMHEWLDHINLQQAKADATDALNRSRDLLQRVNLLEGKLEKMTVLATALWEIVAEKCAVSEEELGKRAEAIIARNAGNLGTEVEVPGYCPQCQNKVNPHFAVCVFCGHRLKGEGSIAG